MWSTIPYESLDKHFTAPKIISPFYKKDIKISRKLKKKVKKFCGVHWKNLDNTERLWYYMEKSSINYKWFLIKEMIRRDDLKNKNY